MHRTIAALTLSTLTLAGMTGCLVTSSNSSSFTGDRVSPGADRGIVLGQSTPDQAIATLGEPTNRVGDPANETLTWRWTERSQSSGSVFLIFGGSSNSTHERALHVAFEDGIAARRWRE